MNLTQTILVAVIVGLIVYDIFAKPTLSQALRDWFRHPAIYAILGVPIGALLWGQRL